MPALDKDQRIEFWPVSRLLPYERNARTHSDSQIAQVAASITEFGWTNPILTGADGVVIAGHARLAAARKLGMAEVPVIVLDHLTPAQRRALILADNKLAMNAGWDEGLLSLELGDLKALDYDLSFTGFDLAELDRALLPEADPAEDACPEVPEVAVTQPGDLWLLGKHRVLCGDSTDGDAVSRLLAGQKAPFLMVTDPPYGVDYDPEWRVGKGLFGGHAIGKVSNDDQVDWDKALSLFPGDVIYLWHGALHASEVAATLTEIQFEIRSQIIWSKQKFPMSRGHYHWMHEPCWYAVRKGRTGHWHGDRTQTTIWQVANLNPMGGNKDEVSTGHSTQKPVELFRRPILNHTLSKEAVYDPFLGSGTCLVAAEATGRICYGLEISPAYVDVIVKRFQDLTGKHATLEGHGWRFNDTAGKRGNP